MLNMHLLIYFYLINGYVRVTGWYTLNLQLDKFSYFFLLKAMLRKLYLIFLIWFSFLFEVIGSFVLMNIIEETLKMTKDFK